MNFAGQFFKGLGRYLAPSPLPSPAKPTDCELSYDQGLLRGGGGADVCGYASDTEFAELWGVSEGAGFISKSRAQQPPSENDEDDDSSSSEHRAMGKTAAGRVYQKRNRADLKELIDSAEAFSPRTFESVQGFTLDVGLSLHTRLQAKSLL